MPFAIAIVNVLVLVILTISLHVVQLLNVLLIHKLTDYSSFRDCDIYLN